MSDLVELRFTALEEFAAVDEPGAEPLASVIGGGVLIPSNGNVLIYGAGGAGKTTLVIDLAFALAAGEPWLGLARSGWPLKVAVVENEGPRPEFRRKLRAKLHAASAALEGRIVILDEPWGELTLADESHRRALALALFEQEVDLLVFGPLVSGGEFPQGGTPDEIWHFEQHVGELRRLVGRPFAILLVHHENRAGQVSGAWERFPDTLVHVTAQGHGRTRLVWQKARWASSLHGKSTHLVWADGETYVVEEKPEISEDTMREDLVEAVRANPGASWTQIRDSRTPDGSKRVHGNTSELQAIRNQLLAEGELVNLAVGASRFELWTADDVASRSGVGTDLERVTAVSPAGGADPVRSSVPSSRGNGDGNGTGPPEPALDEELDWR